MFVDESGNTGAHLFDEAQPIFLTVALMTCSDFDAINAKSIAALARNVGDKLFLRSIVGDLYPKKTISKSTTCSLV